jgi:hypothetical protein
MKEEDEICSLLSVCTVYIVERNPLIMLRLLNQTFVEPKAISNDVDIAENIALFL